MEWHFEVPVLILVKSKIVSINLAPVVQGPVVRKPINLIQD